MSVHFCTFGISFFHVSQVSELLNKNINIDTMNKSSRSKRITRGSEKKKKEEEDLKKKTKIRNAVRTRLEEKNMRSLEELRLRSEGIGLSSIFDMDDDGSDTSPSPSSITSSSSKILEHRSMRQERFLRK